MFSKKKLSKDFIEEIDDLISRLHDGIIEQSGGVAGIRDAGGLYHSIYKVLLFHEEHSQNPKKVATFIYEEFARRHHFNDGNKRTAHAFAKIILFISGLHLKIEYKKAVKFIVEIAKFQSKVTTKEIHDWINAYTIPIREKDLEKYLKETILDIIENENQS